MNTLQAPCQRSNHPSPSSGQRLSQHCRDNSRETTSERGERAMVHHLLRVVGHVPRRVEPVCSLVNSGRIQHMPWILCEPLLQLRPEVVARAFRWAPEAAVRRGCAGVAIRNLAAAPVAAIRFLPPPHCRPQASLRIMHCWQPIP